MFSENLRSLRKAYGLTQRELAEEMDLTLRTIQNYERGNILPKKRNTIQRLAEFFEVPISALLGPEDFYVLHAGEQGGPSDAVKVRLLLSDMTALFAGGKLEEEDKALVMRTLNDLYWESKAIKAAICPGKRNPPDASV
ncbi:MAG TPA: helix-turn-helix transcriptional regulator [Clostridiales bacterium]|jgi:transcriptional regulator with XRE-family HTH domain|nr:helix-turn-helix transcriptional regulator [Clostridiales bacterium]